ncbi:hypothetical protein BDZ94DRAFT_1272009 [Collybia nuda]|uniref:Uncharacterized protein n=1 Tax=Collybia nuda TaxID=64659 RepID=A0A9P6CA41_9AGAR|nr:hypothetical protein BDZ94DRAFT_1272009 [Collybia nuda]
MFKPRSAGRLLNTTFSTRSPLVARPICREVLRLNRVPGHPSISRRSFLTSTPRFSTSTPPPPASDAASDPAKPGSESEPNPNEKISPDRWIGILENTASAPWLNELPLEHGDRLKRAYTLLFQIVLYLGRPQEADMAEQFLVAFGTAPTPPESEIGRARKAVASITRAVVRDISSIPLNSPLRTEQTEVFGIFGALQALHDMYLMDAEVDNWGEFWSRAQPVVLSLGMKLDEVGFGLNIDEFEKAEREKDEAKKGEKVEEKEGKGKEEK